MLSIYGDFTIKFNEDNIVFYQNTNLKGVIILIEKDFNYTLDDNKLVEKIISDGNVDLNHMIFPKGDRLPVHNANSNVYMIIVRGQMTISLGDQEAHKYKKGKILNIPYGTKMNVRNEDDDVLEFFVIKAPSPINYK